MYKIELTQDQLEIIAKALAECPWKIANPILSSLEKQIRETVAEESAEE